MSSFAFHCRAAGWAADHVVADILRELHLRAFDVDNDSWLDLLVISGAVRILEDLAIRDVLPDADSGASGRGLNVQLDLHLRTG